MFYAMIIKELKLVLQDKRALAALFVLPALFIVIMSVALKNQFTPNKIHVTLLIKDLDHSALSKEIIAKIRSNKSFSIVAVGAQITITIPRDYHDRNSGLKVGMIINDALNGNLVEICRAKLLQDLLHVRLKRLQGELAFAAPKVAKNFHKIPITAEKLFNLRYAHIKKIPNSTQQSVPAWIVFGMFFIIIPMSTIFISERRQNTFMRLNTMNVSVTLMTLSKIIPYVIINQFQLWIMIGVGVFIVPFFGAPALTINGSFLALSILAFALSISAVGLSLLIASTAHSSEQATTIGGILNILLGAIGGIMVPKFIMPESMQRLAEISPMSWGLDGFLKIFLKHAAVSEILNEILLLFLFGAICTILSISILKIKIQKGM